MLDRKSGGDKPRPYVGPMTILAISRGRSLKPLQCTGELKESVVASKSFVIASCDSTKTFDVMKKAFYEVSNAIESLIVTPLGFTRGVWRYNSFYIALFECLHNSVCVVAAISNARIGMNIINQFFGNRGFMLLALSYECTQWSSCAIHKRVNLCRWTTTRSTYGVFLGPLLPPAESWWARTIDASTIPAISSSFNARALKMSSHRSVIAHSRNLL